MRLPDRVLDPVERLSEILFGLIMALTITGAVSVATADRFAIRTMLFAALGCNVAWGIIDAGMYLMARLGERGRNALAVRAVRETTNREDAHRMIAEELPPLLAPAFQPVQLELLRERINKIPASNLLALSRHSKLHRTCLLLGLTVGLSSESTKKEAKRTAISVP
jgi:hypothetical protein